MLHRSKRHEIQNDGVDADSLCPGYESSMNLVVFVEILFVLFALEIDDKHRLHVMCLFVGEDVFTSPDFLYLHSDEL